MNRRILIAAGLFPPDIGGPATYAAMIAAELPKRGLEIDVVPFGRVRQHFKLWRHVVYAFLLWQKSKEADVIYALDPMSVGWPAMVVSRWRRIPFVVRLGGDYAWEQGVQRFKVRATLDEYSTQPRSFGWRVRVYAWFQRYVVVRATRVIVPSEYLRSKVIEWPGVDAYKVTVIYSVLFPLRVTTARSELRSQLGYGGFTIVTACRLTPWKGVEGLISVMAELLPRIPELQLVIAGDGPLRASLEDLISTQQLTEHIRLVGGLGKEALGAAIKAADVFALNTAYEGLSHTLLEVMDLGTPIITTPVGGNPELLEDGKSARLVDFDDSAAWCEAIMKLYHNPQLRTQYAQHAHSLLQTFDREAALASITEILSSVAYEA